MYTGYMYRDFRDYVDQLTVDVKILLELILTINSSKKYKSPTQNVQILLVVL